MSCVNYRSASQRTSNGGDLHYNDVIMTTMASQITSLTVVYSNVYSDADQRKHQSSALLTFVGGIHRDRWIPRTKGQLRGQCFHSMTSSWEGPATCDVTIMHNFITVTSQWAVWRLKSPASRICAQPFVQANIKENIKAPRHWSLAFVRGIHQWPMNSLHKRPVTRKMFKFDDVIMTLTYYGQTHSWLTPAGILLKSTN